MDQLYLYQQRVFDLLTSGRNVILQAPTGAGKTVAALYPLLETFDNPKYHFPTRCIYSVPMRILANQFRYEANKWVDTLNRTYHTNLSVAIQTGDNPQSREFTHNLIFATIDQTLSSFLMSPYSLPTRQGNINAGAIMSSYLVFDEFHLYDPNTTLPTTLYMLKQLKGIAPFLLMTATFSREMLQGLAEQLDAVVVPENDEQLAEILTIPSQDKTRRYHTSEEILSADIVLQKHDKRSLVICNQVDRARQIYRELQARKSDDIDLFLLHSRFLPVDRKQIEDKIRHLFGKENHDGNYIVVSTQAIEVGVDITCTVLHTELAPANAIIQRAGRCARYKGNQGYVYIYRYVNNPKPKLEDDTILDLLEKVMPYKEQEDIFAKAWEQFSAKSGDCLTYKDELEIVSAVHAESDGQILDQLRSDQYRYKNEMHDLMDGGKKSDAKHFIRDIVQQNVTIHDNPDALGNDVMKLPSISLHPGTLQGYISGWLEQDYLSDVDWIVKYVYEPPNDNEAQANENRYLLDEINNKDEVKKALGSPLVIIHPDFATYTAEEGFIPDRGGEFTMKLPDAKEKSSDVPYGGYKLETYEEHIRLVYQAFEEQWQDVAWGAQQMERAFNWEQGIIRRAAELAVLLHDVGKLSRDWQTWAHNYQEALFKVEDEIRFKPESNQAYAHTDQDYSEKRKKIEASIKPRRPWHAVEGALGVSPILINEFREYPEIIGAIYSSIARHHAPSSASNQESRLIDNAEMHILRVMQHFNFNLSSEFQLIRKLQENEDRQKKNVIMLGVDPQESVIKAFQLYCLLVRALRRADMLGTERGKRGNNSY